MKQLAMFRHPLARDKKTINCDRFMQGGVLNIDSGFEFSFDYCRLITAE